VTKSSERRSYACSCKAKFTLHHTKGLCFSGDHHVDCAANRLTMKDMKAHSHTYLRLISPTVSKFLII
jgi:hypothetical protein